MRNNKLALLMAALAMADGAGTTFALSPRKAEGLRFGVPRTEPENRGRRAEKDAAALAKAEAKRRRKAAKRLAAGG